MKRRPVARSRGRKIPPPARPMRMARKCCVLDCDADVQEARNKGLPLHKFPKDAILRSKWLTSGGFDTNFKPTPGQVVCYRHFKRADYESVAKGHKFSLKKGSVPSIFQDYDNHPDPVVMSVKSSTSYAQEDLDLINSEILNMSHSRSSLPGGSTKTLSPDKSNESNNSESKSLTNPSDALNLTLPMDNGYKLPNAKGEYANLTKRVAEVNAEAKTVDNIGEKVENVAMRLGIVEQHVTTMEDIAKDAITKDEPKDAKVSESRNVEKGESRSKLINRGGLKFFPGAKLEAKDFNEKWYSAKIVETDWVEQEVLIHFDKWSSRFDEWIPMDSSRLRVLQAQPTETKVREFSVGERILATWVDGRKYPAKINAVLGNDRYDVLFDDGYAKIIRSSKMTKIATTPTKHLPGQGEEYIGSKQERRDKKRKHTVMELFNTHSRRRSKNEMDKATKKDATVTEAEDYCLENKVDLDGTLFGACYDPGTDLLRGFDPNIPKVKTYAKKAKKEILSKNSTEHEENIGPEWVDGEPQGVESFIVDGNDGPRRSIIVPDKRLPPGWQKHFTQRKAGTSAGKWDVLFIHKSSGKKFRSRNDIRAFMENQGQYDFDPERFDFCIHRKKRNSISRSKQEPSVEVPKKIKTLLPKSKTSFTTDNTLLSTSPNPAVVSAATPPTTPANDGAVFIGGLRVEMEDSAYKCPKKECNKNFRKENLLQMHIKHYHPEYSKFLGSTPNVADLAYARTIGESIDDIIPKKGNTFLDRIGKFSKKRSIQDKSPSTGVPSNTNSSQQFPSLTLPTTADVEMDTSNTNGHNDLQKEDIKMETLSCVSNHSVEAEEETARKQENVCAMSPGTLFDMKVKEEKTQSGIKTLLPVRPVVVTSETQRVDRSKSLDEAVQIDQVKGQRKRQLSEYSSDISIKGKRRHGMQEYMDDYEDMDDSALDAEGPTRLMYRYSRRKSDSKSDENSRNSHLNDSHLDKGDPSKGDIAKRDNNDIEESDGVMMLINGEMIKVEQLRKEEIINCTCGFTEEDGLMIQCDLCLCWQHGHCNAIEREKDVPEKYVCYICRHPYRQRPSKKYFHDQDWIKEGKLLSMPSRTKNQDIINTRTAMLKRSYDLVAALLQIQQILHSLRVKINVAQKKDHPKLYLWAKNWEKTEIPKPDVEPVPVFEIAKTDDINPPSENFRRSEIKPELQDITKDEPDDKSIDSDSELMKILEEDSTTSDESKSASKKEDADSHGESHILLDALTRSDDPYEQSKNIARCAGAAEKTDNVDEPLVLGNSTATSARHKDKTQEESAVSEYRPEVSTPLQPFIPEPEAPIDPAECRMRLLEHIEHFQNHIDSRLTAIEAHVCTLENMDPDDVVLSSDVQPRTKQTVQMLLRDLNTVRKLAALC